MTDGIRNAAELLAPAKPNKFSAEWMQENVLNPAVNAGPLNIYNTAAQFVNLPEVHLKTGEAKPYSTEWFAQGLSSGVGAAVPFMLAGAATGSAFKALDGRLSGTNLGATLHPYLASQKVATIAGASMYGFLQKPDADHTRLGNAIGTGVGVAIFAGGNDLVKNMSTLHKALAYPVVGFVGGGAMAEVSQLASNGKLANHDLALQSAVQGMTMNTVMGLSADYLAKRYQKDQLAYENKALESQRVAFQRELAGKDLSFQDLPKDSKAAFARLAELQREYSEHVKKNQPQYPLPEEFAKLSAEEIARRGFQRPDLVELDVLEYFKKDRKPRPLPDAKVVAQEVAKITDKMPFAEKTGDLILGEWNMEFLTADKAKYFSDTYKQIVPKHHLLFVEEINGGGIKQVAKDTGYNFAMSAENSRGQAVGYLINPRLKVLRTTSIDSVANVYNIPDLRPAFRIDVLDTATGKELSAVVVHLKSMRGGPEQTAPVRMKQAQILATELGPNFKGVIAGDWNTFLDRTSELAPLQKAGFQILNPQDKSSTQAMGGRLDGFLFKGLDGTLSPEMNNPFYKNPLITRGLSDHSLLTTTLKTN